MNKALIVSGALALALSGAAFAQSGSQSNSASRSGDSNRITESDCHTLSIESARNDCLRSVHGRIDEGTGATRGAGASGSGKGGARLKRSHKRAHRANAG